MENAKYFRMISIFPVLELHLIKNYVYISIRANKISRQVHLK